MQLRSGENIIDIPLYPGERILDEYENFKKARRKYHKILLKDKFESEDMDHLQDALLEILPTLVTGDLSEIPFYEEGADIEFTIDIGYKGVLSHWHIYTHLLNITDRYQPNVKLDYYFDWFDKVDGETVKQRYYVEPDRAKRLLTRKTYTSGENIELKQFEDDTLQILSNRAKKKGLDTKDENELWSLDVKGNLAFNLSAGQLAILARPEGEKLPLKKSEREALIHRRIELFRELPLDVYLNVRFFLLDILGKLSLKEISGVSISRKRNHFTVMTSKPKKKRKGFKS